MPKTKLKTVHITLQGKGGVGKSLISAFLAQYLQSIGQKIQCVDTDPINQTFSHYKALNVEYLRLMDDNTSINTRNFDSLMERIISEGNNFIVDNGASSFLPLSNYLIENDAISMLEQTGHAVYIHTVITGGQALNDTLFGFAALAKQASIKRIVVWLNEFFGIVTSNNKTFTEMKSYTENKEKVTGIIRIPRRNQQTFAEDIEQMIKKKLTFDEALQSTEFMLMARQRLATVRNDLYKQLAALEF
jgi:CO dehydrogenase nickel-insertion accessory protein CooC1